MSTPATSPPPRRKLISEDMAIMLAEIELANALGLSRFDLYKAPWEPRLSETEALKKATT